MSKDNTEAKAKYHLSPVFYVNDDMTIEAGEFKSATDVFEEFVIPHEAQEVEPPKTDSVSLRIPTHLHEVIKGNAYCLGLNKTQFIIRALEVGINSIYHEFESNNVELSTDGYKGVEEL